MQNFGLDLRALWAVRPRPSWSLLVAICAIVGLTTVVCNLLRLNHVTIYVALVALYIAIGAFGGTLQADMRIALMFCGALIIFVSIPVLLSSWSPLAASILFSISVAICGMIPALGTRYNPVRSGIGLLTVYAYGYRTTGMADRADLIVGAFAALGVIAGMRFLSGARDPEAPLRRSIATVLENPDRRSMEDAAKAWFAGPSRNWTGQVLVGAVEFWAAAWVLQQRMEKMDTECSEVLPAVLSRARELAAKLALAFRERSKDPESVRHGLDQIDTLFAEIEHLSSPERETARYAVAGLRRAAVAMLKRDRRIVGSINTIRRAATLNFLRAAVSIDSEYFRNAMRSMVTVAASLFVAYEINRPAFVLPLPMGAYGVLQPTLARSLAEARRRVLGVACGAVFASLIATHASHQVASIVSIAALIIAFAYIASSIAIFMAGLVATLAISIAPSLHIDPETYAIGYTLSVLAGAGVAIIIGFLTVPPITLARRHRMQLRATHATGAAMRSIRMDSPSVLQSHLLHAFREQQNATMHAAHDSTFSFRDASEALGTLNLLTLALVMGVAKRSAAVDATLRLLSDVLSKGAGESIEPPTLQATGTVLDVADQLLRIEYSRLREVMSSGEFAVFGSRP